MFFRKNKKDFSRNIEHVMLLDVKDDALVLKMWNIYNISFINVNINTPCQQSIKTESEFVDIAHNKKVIKYLTYLNNDLVALALVSKNVSLCPWLSEEYYNDKYGYSIESGKFFYFLGLAVDSKYRRMGIAKTLLGIVLADIPNNATVGFDHSLRVNRFLPYFIKLTLVGKRKIKHKIIDKQLYHIIDFMDHS